MPLVSAFCQRGGMDPVRTAPDLGASLAPIRICVQPLGCLRGAGEGSWHSACPWTSHLGRRGGRRDVADLPPDRGLRSITLKEVRMKHSWRHLFIAAALTPVAWLGQPVWAEP